MSNRMGFNKWGYGLLARTPNSDLVLTVKEKTSSAAPTMALDLALVSDIAWTSCGLY